MHRGGDLYVDPFLSQEEMDEFISSRELHQKFKERRKKEKLFTFEIIKDFPTLHDKISQSNDNERIPLLLSSKSYYSNLKEVIENLKLNYPEDKNQNLDIAIFDLRKFSILRKNGGIGKAYKNLKNDLARLFTKGGLFIINIDDSDVEYEELYDPDLREFYNSDMFPSQILERKNLKIYEVFKKVLKGTEFESTKKLNPDFKVIIYKLK